MAPPLAALEISRTLSKHISAKRLRKVAGVLNHRLKDTALVFENVGNPGNVSACVRTADALGIQRVCVIERWSEQFTVPAGSGGSDGSADKGSTRWLSLKRFHSTDDCLAQLRSEGYYVHATDLGPGAVDINSAIALSLTGRSSSHEKAVHAPSATETASPENERPSTRPRVALVFGNEHRGCSKALLSAADVRFFLPQRGFVQSLNLSVACALSLHSYLHRTPDYATRSLAAHELFQAPNFAMHSDLGSTSSAYDQSGEAYKRRAAASMVEKMRPGNQEDIEKLLSVGAASGQSERGQLLCEGLSFEEKVNLLARFLMADVTNADKILDRAGIRPADY